MFQINDNYLKLPGSYLFSTIAQKVNTYAAAHPEKKIIRLGIGDVTRPLAPAIIEALHAAVDEMSRPETFRGYAPELGYEFLRQAIVENDYQPRSCGISADEIFISDGAKCDSGNIQEIFSLNNKIAVCDPVYPVYVDTNVMAGRAGTYDSTRETWSDVIYMPCTAENNFAPQLPKEAPDIIYLCFPNNPTGSAITRPQLQEWVDYANKVGAVIIYDAAYEAYISEPEVPHSIYECEGARTCAIELRSFSKNAGFTGVRLGFTVVPRDLQSPALQSRDLQSPASQSPNLQSPELQSPALHSPDSQSKTQTSGVSLHSLWARRHGTKYNGAPYIVQRAGEAVYSPAGKAQLRDQVGYYMNNARYIYEGLRSAGYTVSGGKNAPYIWLKAPRGMTSWEFFDHLLEQANVVGTPGSGFGPSGETYFRLTAFGSYENTVEAMERIKAL